MEPELSLAKTVKELSVFIPHSFGILSHKTPFSVVSYPG